MASPLESFSKWLQLKIYQLEVTMSVYIFTPIEKFVFCQHPPPSRPLAAFIKRSPKLTPNSSTEPDSVLFLLISLTFIATVLYLPQHLKFIVSRAWFYMHGDGSDLEQLVKAGAKSLVRSALGTTTAAGTAEAVAKATAAVVKEL